MTLDSLLASTRHKRSGKTIPLQIANCLHHSFISFEGLTLGCGFDNVANALATFSHGGDIVFVIHVRLPNMSWRNPVDR